MARTSVIIPSRDERFLVPTIHDIFRNRRGETEVVAVLDSDKWPDGWKELAAQYPDLHTIHNGQSIGMRDSINRGVGSAISRGAKYIMKLDGHCMLGEGFDTILQTVHQPDWVQVPRRLRLDAENWCVYQDGRPPIDYHYLSFPDNVKDFGGPGLNGKVWAERAKERFGKPEFDLDPEMSSQGSCWYMTAGYFQQLELMDSKNYSTFWAEMQEIGLKCWLSGGQLMVNKKTWYAHLHKGSKYGRGYRLDKSLLTQGATFTKKWLFNEAWAKQTLPFKTLIERFWPVPTWPENWEELVYGTDAPVRASVLGPVTKIENVQADSSLQIHSAHYGVGDMNPSIPDGMATWIDVTKVLQASVVNNSLDIVVTNDALKVGNPFRGQKKRLTVTYSYDGGEPVTVTREERDWLIIGGSARYVKQPTAPQAVLPKSDYEWDTSVDSTRSVQAQVDQVFGRMDDALTRAEVALQLQPRLSPAAVNNLLIRRFKIPDRRLRGPMPIEVPSFHRNDLAALFAELGFNRGAEIGVAEGNYSEVLLQANPQLQLLLVDPWHAYSNNPQNKSKEKNEYAYNETVRKTAPYPNVKLDMRLSMDAVRDVEDGSLDFCYLDAHHSYPFIMGDLIFWSQKVRSGGIVAADDIYRLNEKWGAGPMEAIYDYTSAMKISLWWLIAAHKSVDAFFVKP